MQYNSQQHKRNHQIQARGFTSACRLALQFRQHVLATRLRFGRQQSHFCLFLGTSSTIKCVRICAGICMQDCDASSSFQWQESTAAVVWEQLHDWPSDPMWAESNWPPGQPSLQLFQVSLMRFAFKACCSPLFCLSCHWFCN